MDHPLYRRKVGRTVLLVYPRERSTLAMGRPRQLWGSDTVYTVYAGATKGRNSTKLGDHTTLAQATEYVDSYKRTYGLVSKG